MNGKSKCKILKDIRRRIAEENDIAYITSECQFQGECSGTCPKCESEVRYLEAELEKQQKAGKAVAVAGIAAALLASTTGCGLNDLFMGPTGGAPAQSVTQPSETTEPSETTLPVPGAIPIPEETLAGEPLPTDEILAGVPVEETEEPPLEDLIMGMMTYE